MNLERVDLNLLTYLDVLLREKNVTRAAEQLGVTQPAMSNILRRLRVLFNDPLLIRSSEGMTPTERALELQPSIREVLSDLSQILEPRTEFRPLSSNRVFRIMASDYAEATLIPALVKAMRSEALAKGARVLCGGTRHARGGNFYQPTVLADVTPEMVGELYR